MGCIDYTVRYGGISTDWVAFGLDKLANTVSGSNPAVPVQLGSATLQTFNLNGIGPQRVSIQILPSQYFIGEDRVFIVFPARLTVPFAAREKAIRITCTSTDELVVFSKNTKSSETRVTKNADVFEAVPKVDVSAGPSYLHLVATGRTSNVKFRVFALSPQKLSVVWCLSPQGLIQLWGTGSTVESGFRRQLIRPGTVAYVYKSWDRDITKEEIDVPVVVTIKKEVKNEAVQGKKKDSNKYWWFTVEVLDSSGKTYVIPWSVKRYSANMDEFFKSLGIRNKKKGSTKDEAYLTDYGVLQEIGRASCRERV
jgi:hypothetical protein